MLVTFLAVWVPALCVATMLTAAVGSGVLHEWNKMVFWILDAAITGWSAFMLQ